MVAHRIVLRMVLVLVALETLAGAPGAQSAPASGQRPLSEFWEQPRDLAERNLFDGPWGKDLAPDPAAIYGFLSAKSVGISPGYGVVDASGRVHGVEGLRVVDASIMPDCPRVNINATTMMVAEKIADAIVHPASPMRALGATA